MFSNFAFGGWLRWKKAFQNENIGKFECSDVIHALRIGDNSRSIAIWAIETAQLLEISVNSLDFENIPWKKRFYGFSVPKNDETAK
jgi:hypothetical protein